MREEHGIECNIVRSFHRSTRREIVFAAVHQIHNIIIDRTSRSVCVGLLEPINNEFYRYSCVITDMITMSESTTPRNLFTLQTSSNYRSRIKSGHTACDMPARFFDRLQSHVPCVLLHMYSQRHAPWMQLFPFTFLSQNIQWLLCPLTTLVLSYGSDPFLKSGLGPCFFSAFLFDTSVNDTLGDILR